MHQNKSIHEKMQKISSNTSWMKHYINCSSSYSLEEQGYTIMTNILFQDNKNAMILEIKGKKLTQSAPNVSKYDFSLRMTKSARINLNFTIAQLKPCGQIYTY